MPEPYKYTTINHMIPLVTRRYLKIAAVFILSAILFLNFTTNVQATVKVLNNSSHANGNIRSTINQLLGVGHLEVDIFVHRTALNDTYSGNPAIALNTTAIFYETANTNATNSAPYQIYSSSFTGYGGDTVSRYNEFDGVDLVHNYASTAHLESVPPVFHVALGGPAFGSKRGVEWTINGTEITLSGSTLSELTARNAGLLASIRYNHPNWNWFDVKAAIRQTASNWNTGYDDTTYGFGNAFYASSTTLTDGELLLQPPAAYIGTTSLGQVKFTLYPYKQTRRVKEVLFQFASDPGFQANELTLSDIVTLGGTKVMEYTDTTATSTLTPIHTPLSGAYFSWFTADDINDNSANFSRIDTYSVLGPISQSEINFSDTFDLISPSDYTGSETVPAFSWSSAASYLGITKYQLYIDNVLNRDNITTTTATPTAPLADGVHTWHVVAVNGNGATTSSLSTRTIQVITGYNTGQVWYIDNVLGDDNNTGTIASPWATLSKATTVAQAGNTVIVKRNEGVPYRESVSPSTGDVSSGDITFQGEDVANKPEIWGSDNVSQSVVNDWTIYEAGATSTYKRTIPTVSVLAVGPSINDLTKAVLGSDPSTLNEGEWIYSSGSSTLYYRLSPGQDINTLHIEAGQRQSSLTCSGRNTFRNFVVRYTNTNSVYLDSNCTGERLEVYDSGENGIYLVSSGSALKHSIASNNGASGIALLAVNNANVYNNISYNNNIGLYVWILINNSVIRNNIFTNNTTNIDVTLFGTPTNLVTSHNNWYSGGIDAEWIDLYQGTNNNASTSPLIIDGAQRNFRLQQLSPNIDSGTVSLLATDILGNPIYGSPDIGPHEYQPPFIIGTHNINKTGSVRIYADGKYRYTNATSSSDTVTLSISPLGGFSNDTYHEYLNLTINTWEADSENAVKEWTASSSYATSTVFSIADLSVNTDYGIKIDNVTASDITGSNCNSGVCTTDSNGTLTFTYTGGWSTHTFTITRSPVPVPATSSTSGGSGSRKKNLTELATLDETTASSTEDGDDFALKQKLIAKILELQNLLANLKAQLATQNSESETYMFNRPLLLGTEDQEVLLLQRKLNKLGFIIAKSGPGSPGNETTYFGSLTMSALQRFQCTHNIVCEGRPEYNGYGLFGPQTRAKINEKNI